MSSVNSRLNVPRLCIILYIYNEGIFFRNLLHFDTSIQLSDEFLSSILQDLMLFFSLNNFFDVKNANIVDNEST